MNAKHYSEVPKNPVLMPGAKDVQIQILISEDDGAPNFTMRIFTVAPGGETPLHTHSHEHEIFVLSGEGIVLFGGVEYELKPGCFKFIVPNVEHRFRNTGDEDLVFICVVPN